MDKFKLFDLLTMELETIGYEVVELECLGPKNKPLFRVYIDKLDEIEQKCTVTIEDCEKVSRVIERALDVEYAGNESYVLEVSTPGIERPLKHFKDYRRFKGKLARVTLNEAVNGEVFFEGRIDELDKDFIFFEISNKKNKIAFKNIKRAKLIFER